MNAPPIAEYPKATSPDEPKEERELLWSVFQEGTCELAILVQLGAGSLKYLPSSAQTLSELDSGHSIDKPVGSVSALILRSASPYGKSAQYSSKGLAASMGGPFSR